MKQHFLTFCSDLRNRNISFWLFRVKRLFTVIKKHLIFPAKIMELFKNEGVYVHLTHLRGGRGGCCSPSDCCVAFR